MTIIDQNYTGTKPNMYRVDLTGEGFKKNCEAFINDVFYGTSIIWRKFPDDPPPALDYGQYKSYLVALKDKRVFECSWLFGGWHTRQDGCGDRTKEVLYWCRKPKFPPC